MIIDQEIKGSLVILSLNGRLDTLNFPLLEKKVTELIHDSHKSILLDCQDLDYISSSGLRVLLKSLKQAESVHGRLTICSFQPQIAQIFKISGFDRLFEIYPGKQQAVASYL
jgi:anti-sigma B factor antagonist